jgi:hypothetical protein
MGQRDLTKVRTIALSLPAVTERLSHGTPCFYVRDKKPLCYFHDVDFHTEGSRVALWCPAPTGTTEELVAAEPSRFFQPTPSASGTFSGWLGVYLDDNDGDPVDWDEVAAIVEDAYRLIAPKKLIAELDQQE